MSVYDLRMHIEQAIPAWTIAVGPVVILLSAIYWNWREK